jgi:hypothetical protein
MEPIIYAATKSTPAVHFNADAGILTMQGESYPENAFEFYQPLIRWVEEYLTKLSNPVILQLRLTYLNTSSTRCMLTLLDRFEAAYQQNLPVAVHWYYHADDDRALEAGEEFSEDLTVPFVIKMFENCDIEEGT